MSLVLPPWRTCHTLWYLFVIASAILPMFTAQAIPPEKCLSLNGKDNSFRALPAVHCFCYIGLSRLAANAVEFHHCSGSVACPLWQDFFVSLENTSRFQFNSTVESFDASLFSYVNNPHENLQWLRDYWNCTGGNLGSYMGGLLNYRISMLCADIIVSEHSRACNNGRYLPPLCKESCMAYAASLEKLLGDLKWCPQPKDPSRDEKLRGMYERCSYYPFNGTEIFCAPGAKNEQLICGSNGTKCLGSTCDVISPCNTTALAPTSDKTEDGAQSSRIKNVVLVCASILGVLLAVSLAIMLFRHFRRRGFFHSNATVKPTSPTSPPLDPASRQHMVVHPFFARREDELSLNRDDAVTIQRVYDDGWALGEVVETGKRGVFPLVCIAPTVPAQATSSSRSAEKRPVSMGTIIPTRTSTGSLAPLPRRGSTS
ncbi:uncharacterized protein VTP21DRAFT_2408 [Calcarisporiella thermophila]|uniref:uncharacterized protein n=1 Tax=Calcarisporiella thermophila TaxID=911321 RepID=UPI003742BC94